MNAKLLVVMGKTTRREVALQLPAVLGRSREADVTVAHPLISRRHCEISEDNGLLVLRDLTSLNGTMIGGRRIEFAALLPDAEFTIGPLTFRVLYAYDGDLESVPETRFVAAAEGSISAEAHDMSVVEGEEVLPSGTADESLSGEVAMPDFMALADADLEEVLPAAPASPMPTPRGAPTASTGALGPRRPDKQPTVPTTDALDAPMEVDSSLQSGSLRQKSPWAATPPAVEKPRNAPPTPVQSEPQPLATSVEQVAQPPPKEKPPAATPTGSVKDDEGDPEFGSFLEALE